MIFGAHVVVYSKDAAADRAFFHDVLGYASVDAGHDWLIFALPPAELAAILPTKMAATSCTSCAMTSSPRWILEKKGIACAEVEEARVGVGTKIRLPGGGQVGLYQPKHPTALRVAHPEP